MTRRNKFEMYAHDIQYRKRDKQEAQLGETTEKIGFSIWFVVGITLIFGFILAVIVYT